MYIQILLIIPVGLGVGWGGGLWGVLHGYSALVGGPKVGWGGGLHDCSAVAGGGGGGMRGGGGGGGGRSKAVVLVLQLVWLNVFNAELSLKRYWQ